jgi:predicted nucleic-acid-binding Zn-ribbon protein
MKEIIDEIYFKNFSYKELIENLLNKLENEDFDDEFVKLLKKLNRVKAIKISEINDNLKFLMTISSQIIERNYYFDNYFKIYRFVRIKNDIYYYVIQRNKKHFFKKLAKLKLNVKNRLRNNLIDLSVNKELENYFIIKENYALNKNLTAFKKLVKLDMKEAYHNIATSKMRIFDNKHLKIYNSLVSFLAKSLMKISNQDYKKSRKEFRRIILGMLLKDRIRIIFKNKAKIINIGGLWSILMRKTIDEIINELLKTFDYKAIKFIWVDCAYIDYNEFYKKRHLIDFNKFQIKEFKFHFENETIEKKILNLENDKVNYCFDYKLLESLIKKFKQIF